MIKIIIICGELLLTITGKNQVNDYIAGQYNVDYKDENRTHTTLYKNYNENFNYKIYKSDKKIQALQSLTETLLYKNKEIAAKLKIYNKYLNFKFKENKLFRNQYNKFI